jgi:predicted TIM-barrel enzyme
LHDLDNLVAGGFQSVMVENYHDIPFHPGSVPAVTVAAMAALLTAMKDRHPRLSLGVNVLRNDVASALALAAVCGGASSGSTCIAVPPSPIRAPSKAEAWETLRLRRELGVEQVGILADLRVKHAQPLAARLCRTKPWICA